MTEAERIRIELVVDPHLDGLRADSFLATKIRRLSRSRAQQIVRAGDLRRGDEVLKPASRVHADERLALWKTPLVEPEAPEHYDVLHDDARLLVINKPAGLAIHPSARYYHTTLTQLLRRQHDAQGLSGLVPRPCHRLDRETSGVLLLARELETERCLKQAFERGQVHKLYWALVEGQVVEQRFEVDLPLAPGGGAIRIRMTPRDDGAPAHTVFERLAVLGDRSLVACFPRTGRTHQIRAHLAARGYPIVGDKIYGAQGEDWFLRWAEGGEEAAPLAELAWPRHCLHARALELDPQLDVTPRRFVAPWAEDLPALPDGLESRLSTELSTESLSPR